MVEHLIRMMRPVCVIIPVILLAACRAEPVAKYPTPLESLGAELRAPTRDYVIAPSDELEIRFFHTPELNVLLPVRPDGYISLPFAHELRAAGRTPAQLREELVRRYEQELEEPEIAVIVRSFGAYRVHVGGEVESPGVFPLIGTTTVLQSILEAGGFLPTARPTEVLVIRRTPDSHIVIPVNLTEAIDGSDTTQNIVLAPYDAVFVPTSPIADINTWVDQYIRRNIPVSFSVRPDLQ